MIKITYHLIGRHTGTVDAKDEHATFYDVAFTDPAAADRFIRVQDIPNGFSRAFTVAHPDDKPPHAAHRQIDQTGTTTLVPVAYETSGIAVDPFVEVTARGLALWHVEGKPGNFRAYKAFAGSKACSRHHLPTSQGTVFHKLRGDGVHVVHLFAANEKQAISSAQEAILASAF